MLVHRLPPDLQTDLAILFLADDTEEDLVGSDLHQDAIHGAQQSLRAIARRRRLPWHVSNQLNVLMGEVGGKEWQPSPDVFVHPTAGPAPRVSFNVSVEGVPPVVTEVACPSTWENDIGTKRRMYGRVGVREYLVFDPTTELLGTSVRAWHATPKGFVAWPSRRDGSWQSTVLGVTFKPEGLLLRVADQDGVIVPTFDELARMRAQRNGRQ